MGRHHQIHGLLMYPCSVTQEDHEKTIFSAKESVRKDFKKTYEHLIASKQIVAESAKIYILNNWKKVKKSRWKYLNISVVDNTGKETYYYNFKEEKRVRDIKKKEREKKAKLESKNNPNYKPAKSRDFFRDLWKRREKLHNPIASIKGVVLDTTDGDFSFTINGKDHLWVDQETVIVMADFIENELKNNNE